MTLPELYHSAIDHEREAARGWRIVEKGHQWPKSLQEFASRLRAKHEFYEWVLNLGM